MPVAMPEPSVDDEELADAPLPGLNDICANLLAEARPVSRRFSPVPVRPRSRGARRSHWSPYDRVRDVNADP
jgi:hypothetical protein